ncbi:hypothetical protein OUZ56_029756 [Daphnia magna]|uniref:Glycoprotein n=1 Tax=Daphnia magna TaxID=35525 RepID=A0ABR0B859_9CRUS|nr:hypothetical protein OUZ56_029756 [Daphnia magna]
MLLYFMLPTILCTTALAFETIIFNCDNPSAKEHLRTNDENCPSLLKPKQKEVDYMLWTNRRAGIEFQASICGRWMKINHITTDFFTQKIIVPETVALLIRQVEDDIFKTPLGKAKVSDGIHTHNHLTIIWDITVAAAFDKTPRLVSSGEGAIIKTSTPGIFHLEDEKQQLAFHIKPEGRCLTTACRHKNESFKVIGDEHLFISIPHLDDDSEESDYEPPQRETTTLSNTSKNNTVTALEQILNTQVGLTAHVQFVRDKLTEQENDIPRIVRNTQCELVRTKRALATSAAQYDGWLAASILQLPECMNLQAQGETVLLKQCRSIRITFATETTSCGPQPRFKNFTIATNGLELAPYSPCYWRDHYVNFNGRHHVYRNGTWKKAEANLLQPERDLPTSFRYDDDNTHDYEPQANPAYDGITTSHMNIIADLAAAMAEQSMKTGINSSTAMRNIIVTAEEKTGITSYMSWWETFKIIMFFIGLAIICAIAFKILRWFGVFKMISTPPIEETDVEK